jgi:WD40 repeat protein
MVIRGTEGLGDVWHLTESRPSGRIFVSGILKTQPRAECGTYEIDQDSEQPRKLLVGVLPDCGGGGGEVSPDGARVIGYSGGKLRATDLRTGKVRVIEDLKGLTHDDAMWRSEVSWSPDGRWIAIGRDSNGVVLIDVDDPSKRRNLKSPDVKGIAWSPDSKTLLISGAPHCGFGYFESLATLDVESGKSTVVKSARCKIAGGWVGWINADAIP